MKVIVPETRGRNRKYHFNHLKIGERQSFGVPVTSLSSSAQYWAEKQGWKIRCYTDEKTGNTIVIRIA